MPVVSTSAKGQVVIPAALRKKIGLRPGAKVQVALGDRETIILRPVPRDPIEAACGFLKGGPSLTEALRKEHKDEQSREDAKRARLVRADRLPRKGTRLQKGARPAA